MFGLWSIALADDVTLRFERYEALTRPEGAPEPAPAPFVSRRDVVVRRFGDALRLTATFRIEVPDRAAVSLPLVGPGLQIGRFTVDGRPGALVADENGAVWVDVVERSVRLELEGVLVDPGAGLPLLEAGAGDVLLPSELALVGGIEVAPNRWVPADPASLGIVERAPAERDRGEIVFGSVGYGLTFADGELRRVAHLRWEIRSGTLSEVAFTVPGAGPDLRVEGAQVGEVARSGDRVVVTLSRPESERLDLVVRTTTMLGTGELEAVAIAPPVLENVFRSETALVLARDGEMDLLPEVSAPPIPITRLPDWASGLVDGITTGAFQGPTVGGKVDAARFTPTSGPATLCDVASFTIAFSPEGRALLRAHYTVRNDRGHLLRIDPPEGFEPISAQVSQEPVTVSRAGDDWLVPLAKSLETAEGLLTFPVEVAFLGTAEPFDGRVRRDFPLPAIDVETAVTRVTVHLPPGWENKLRADTEDQVADFTEGRGVSYGFAVGDTRAAEAEMYFQDALDSWYANDFDRAQQALDAISSLGGSNANMVGLQSNLDVVSGKKSGGESAADRRIKDQARARAFDDYEEQRDLLELAEEATNSGDYDTAEEAYQQAARLTEKLDKIANVEDVEQEDVLEKTKNKRDTNFSASSAKAAYRSSGLNAAYDEPAPDPNAPLFEPEVDEEPVAFEDSSDGDFGGFEGGVVGGVVGGTIGWGPSGAEEQAAEAAAEVSRREDEERQKVAEEARVVVSRQSIVVLGGDELDEKTLEVDGRFGRETAMDFSGEIVEGELVRPEGATAPPPPPPPPLASPTPTAPPPAVATSESTRGQPLTKEMLNRIPTGRDYQSAVQNAVGVQPGSGGNPNISGGGTDENTYMLDGIDVVDPVTVTFGANFDAPAAPAASGNGGRPKREAADQELVIIERKRGFPLPLPHVHPPEKRPEPVGHYEPPPAKVGVTATSASVVVPTTGDPVRYQHLLLPAGEQHTVRIDTRLQKAKSKKSRSSG